LTAGHARPLNVRGRSSDTVDNQTTVSANLDDRGELEFYVRPSYVVDNAVDFQFVVAWRTEGVLLEHPQEWRHAQVSP
jgi:hypothetical protein